jgi:methyl-accepting chemotaxis protein
MSDARTHTAPDVIGLLVLKNQPLRRRFALILGVCVLLTGALVAWFTVFSSRALENANHERSELLAQSIASDGYLGVMMQDAGGLDEKIQRLLTDELALGAAFVTSDGTVLAEQNAQRHLDALSLEGVQTIDTELADETPVTISSAPVVSEDDSAPLGYAVVVVSAQEQRAVVAALTRSGVVAISVFAVLVLLVLLGIQRTVVRPVTRLHAAADAVTSGDLDAHADVDQSDEIGQLAGAFNAMVAAQRTATAELKTQQEQALMASQEAARLAEEAERDQAYLHERFQEIDRVIGAVTEGDLTQTLDVGSSNDGVGQLMNRINRMIGDLNGLIAQVQQSSTSLAGASNSVSVSAEQMAAGAREQAQQTTVVASAVEEMSVTANSSAQNADQASGISEQATQLAAQGEEVFEQTTGSMTRIAEIVRDAAKSVTTLGASSAQIGEIVDVIDDIASQTNLLALNAAIEAARAGEHGRGFAVVADEVRKLAERTSKATEEISSMIRRIQDETREVVSSMEKGNAESDAGLQLAGDAAVLLSRIIESIGDMRKAIDHISKASDEQAKTSAEVARSVESISAVSNETSEATLSLTQTAETMTREVEAQRAVINRFRVRQDGSAAPASPAVAVHERREPQRAAAPIVEETPSGDGFSGDGFGTTGDGFGSSDFDTFS